jgi:hypothetical protein
MESQGTRRGKLEKRGEERRGEERGGERLCRKRMEGGLVGRISRANPVWPSRDLLE